MENLYLQYKESKFATGDRPYIAYQPTIITVNIYYINNFV